MQGTALMLFVAHCDDGELWAGGTVAHLTNAGKRVVFAIANNDHLRRAEAEAGAAVLKCELRFREAKQDITEWVGQMLETEAPEVLVCHPTSDPHFEHSALSASVMRALTKSRQRASFPQRWYWFDTYYAGGPGTVPILIDISSVFENKTAALRCHISQEPDRLVAMAVAMNSLHGQRIRTTYAEAFYPFSLLGRWPRLRYLP
jgi:LmbE family N-acetylglucosaminyl deacetylase